MKTKVTPNAPLQILLNLSEMDVNDRIQLAALIAQFAPQSALYAADPVLKSAADTVVQDGIALDAAAKDAEAKRQAYQAAITALAAIQQQYDSDTTVLKASAQRTCKTDEDLATLGLEPRPERAKPAQPVAPTNLVVKSGKVKGSVDLHVRKIPGLKTVTAMGDDPTKPESFQELQGRVARRTVAGLTSGKQVWFRFATERGVARSEWSDPIPVIVR